MLRTQVLRGQSRFLRPACRPAMSQWQLNRPARTIRFFADDRKPDHTVLPGSLSEGRTDIPAPPKTPDFANTTPAVSPPPTAGLGSPDAIKNIPKTPPTPEQVQSTIPPTGTGTASVAPSVAPTPTRRSGRFRRWFTTLFILSTLGFAGGTYYSLISDEFHDFFTEYVPFAEDAVAYFEEREFRKRFPPREVPQQSYPQIRGENKVTIGRSSGLSPRVAQEEGSDLAQKGRHVSALDDNKPKPKSPAQAPDTASKEDTKPDPSPAKPRDMSPAPAPAASAAIAREAPPPATSTPAGKQIDPIGLPNATEPAIQAAAKMLNDIITVLNADPSASKFQSTLSQARTQLDSIVSSISTLKDSAKKEADDKVASAHKEFDAAAKELVERLQREMADQEGRWRDEYESEREKLSTGYAKKLQTELDTVRKVAEQRATNALREQEILLQKKFAQSVSDRVESERNGRLSKLDALSKSVSELETLTGQWNEVVDANLSTQHLHVALDAVRSAIAKVDHPTPFVAELAALQDVSNKNEVVGAAIKSIPAQAYQSGLPSPAHLIDRFRRVASEVRKAALLPEDAGVASHAASAVLSRFMFNKKGEGMPEGGDVEAVLTRTEVLLEEGDVDGAAREMNALKGWAGVLSRDWVGECRRVLETRQALDVIATEARLQSLLVQ